MTDDSRRTRKHRVATAAPPDPPTSEPDPPASEPDPPASEPDPGASDAAVVATEEGAEVTVDTADVQWGPYAPIRKGYGGSSLSFALAGLAASFFVGWAFPLALVGIALGIVAVRKREESTQLGAWSIALGTLAVLYSAGWLLWAAQELKLFG